MSQVQRMSRLMVKTLRESPADAETLSHQLLVRAGYVRRTSMRHLELAPAGQEGARQHLARRPRGDGRHRRTGSTASRAAAPGAVRGQRPLGGVRRPAVPPQGPQGRRLPAGPDPRGDLHPGRQGPVHVLQGPAGDALPDPDEVPRRGQAALRRAARPRVPDEGLVLLRHHGRGPGRVVRAAPRRVPADLRPSRPRLPDRLRGLRCDGRLGVGGVPGTGRGGRGHLRGLPELRLRRQHGGGHLRRPGGRHHRARPRRGAGHPRHPDHRDARRAPRGAGLRDPEEPARQGRRRDHRGRRPGRPRGGPRQARRAPRARRGGAGDGRGLRGAPRSRTGLRRPAGPQDPLHRGPARGGRHGLGHRRQQARHPRAQRGVWAGLRGRRLPGRGRRRRGRPVPRVRQPASSSTARSRSATSSSSAASTPTPSSWTSSASRASRSA